MLFTDLKKNSQKHVSIKASIHTMATEFSKLIEATAAHPISMVSQFQSANHNLQPEIGSEQRTISK